MRIAALLPLIVCFLVAGTAPARASDAVSPFSWLGLGQGKAQAVKTTNVSRTSAPPQALASMSKGTKRLVSNTKNLFVSKKTPEKKSAVTTTTRRKPRTEPPKQSLFKRWFNPEPPPPPRTVGEWMSLEQVHP